MDFGISPSGFRKDLSRAQERLTHRLQAWERVVSFTAVIFGDS